MKNIPHQFSQIPRLVSALTVFEELIRNGQNVDDDGVVGDAFARAGVYNFRYNDRPIEELLEEEHNKPKGSQGTRTCARDIRRLFRLLGFLSEDNSLSRGAKRLVELQHDPLSVESRTIWRTALDEMELTDDDGNTSHPYLTLLKLVNDKPGISGLHLGLCLEAKNDSDEEYQRIKRLTAIRDKETLLQTINVSAHMFENSRKILPSLALQLGDILESEDGYHLNEPDVLVEPSEPTTVSSDRAIRRRRRFNPDRDRGRQSASTEQDRTIWRTYDPDITGIRNQEHERCLLCFSHLLSDHFDKYEGDYDLLVVNGEKVLIVEVKTIRDDAPKQIRFALGQLLFYQHFLIEPIYVNHTIYKLVITDNELDSGLIDFLEKHSIGVVWLPDNQEHGSSRLGNNILSEYGTTLE